MKKLKRVKTRKNLLFRVCVFAFVVYAAITLVEMQTEITSRKRLLDEMRDNVELQRMANKDLQRQLEDGINEETIERIAREKFDYVYPDEIVYFDISGS